MVNTQNSKKLSLDLIDNFCQNIKSFQKHQDLKALESYLARQV